MNPSQPIQNKKQDAFERILFANHLAGFLTLKKNDPSIVVGIEGKWGEGKTSCINLIKEVLKSATPKPILVEYSPWLISTLDSIIEGFFLELASALGIQSAAESARTAAHKVLQFGKLLSPIKLIPGVEPWGTMVESVFSAVGKAAKAGSELGGLSLQARKKDLEKHLIKVNRPIIVIIDDVDRLPPDHVRLVFQMLKAVCDFERVAYLVAYDPETVAIALSYDGRYDGARYIEKIVQVSYRLPRLSFTHMKDYLKKHIKSLIEISNIKLDKVENDLFDTAVDKTELVPALETPRDVVRICNRLRVSALNTVGEVSFADVVVFETLELKFPELSTIIRNEPEQFVSTLGYDEEFTSPDNFINEHRAFDELDEKKVVPIEDLLKRLNYSERKKIAAESLLLFLFPSLAGGDYFQKDVPQRINRISNRDSFLKLLHCGVASFTYSREQAQRFFINPDERLHILAEHRDIGDLYAWIDYIIQVAVESEIKNPIQLCEALLATLEGPELTKTIYSLPAKISEFIYEIIKSRKDQDLSWEILKKLVSSQVSLAVSEGALLRFLEDYGIWENGKYTANLDEASSRSSVSKAKLSQLSFNQLYSAKDLWLFSVRQHTSSEDIIKTQKNVLSILYRWGQLNNNDYSEPQGYVLRLSENDKWLRSFLHLFHGGPNINDMLLFIRDDALDIFIKRVVALGQDDEVVVAFAKRLQHARDARAKGEQAAT